MSSSRAEAARRQSAGQRLPRVRRITDGEPIQRLLGEAALVQVGARPLALSGLDEHLPVPGDRRLQRLAHAPLAPILARGALGELHARPLGQPRQRLAEVEAVALHQEGEDVATLAAAEAVPRLAVGADDERRRLLRVERAQALEGGACPLESNRLANEVGNRNLRFDLGSDAGGGRGHSKAQAKAGRNLSRGLSIAARLFYPIVKVGFRSAQDRQRNVISSAGYTQPHHSGHMPTRHSPGGERRRLAQPCLSRPGTPDQLRAAFWDAHAARLHGFALLITVGDRPRAASAAATAMAAGAERAPSSGIPSERPAWLRHQVIRELRRTRPTRNLTQKERHAALRPLGVTERRRLVAPRLDRRAPRSAGGRNRSKGSACRTWQPRSTRT